MDSHLNAGQIHSSFFNLSPEMLAVLGEDGRFLNLNPSWEKTLGFSAAELKDIPFFELIHPQEQSIAQLEIQKLLQGQTTCRFETRCRCKNKNDRWVRWDLVHSPGESVFHLTGWDITELKETQKALAEHRDKFKRLTESATEGVAIHEKGVILEANEALAHMFGFEKAEDLIGKNGLDLAAPEYHQLILNHIVSGFEGAYEVVAIRKQGTRFYCQLLGRPISYQGRMVRVSTFLDITSVKKREQELFESQELFRKLAEASKDGIAVSEQGKILMANPALAKMFGVELSEMIGRNALEFTATESREILLKKVLEEVETPYEVMGLRRDGTRFPVEITARMTSYQGRRVRVAFFRDITRRRQIEEEVLRQKEFSQNLINSSVDGLLAFDLECRYTLWNPAMERISGHSREEVMGHCAFDVFPFLKQVGEDHYFYEALQGRICHSKEQSYRTPAGRQGYFEAHYMPIRNLQGQLVGGLGVIHDITERKKAEIALRQSELNLKAVFNNTFQNIVLMDMEGRIRDFNLNAAGDYKTSTGLDLEVGRSLLDYVPPSRQGQIKGFLKKVSQGEVIQLENTYRMGDGQNQWFEINYHPVFDEKGEIEGICLTSLNINDRKKNEEAVQKSAADMRALFNSSPGMIVLVDRQCKIRDFNQNAGKNFKLVRGIDVEIGRSLADYVEPAFVGAFHERFKKVLKGESIRFERTVESLEGKAIWFEFIYNPVLDDRGKVIGVCVTILSIDDRKKAEANLRESQERFERLTDVTQEGILIHNQARIVDANPALAAMLGYRIEEIIGKTGFDLLAEESHSRAREALETSSGEPYEALAKRKDGSLVPIELEGRNFQYKGKELRVMSVRDITRRKESEKALRRSETTLKAIFNSVIQSVILMDKQGIVQAFNQNALALARLIYGAELSQGKLYADFIGDKERVEKFNLNFQKALLGETLHVEREFSLVDGTRQWIEYYYHPVSNESGEIIGACLTAAVIDKRKKSEEALRQSEAQLRAVFDSGPQLIIVLNRDYQVKAFNKKVLESAHRDNQPVLELEHYFLDYVPEANRQTFVAGFETALTGKEVRDEGSYITPNGEEKWVEVAFQPIFNEQNKVDGVCFTTTFVDERKKAEKAFRESEDRYRRLVESTPEALLVHRDGKIIYMNPSGLQMLGASHLDQLIGKPALDIVHPDYREEVATRLKMVREERKSVEPLEQKMIRLDGQIIDVEVKGLPFTYEGKQAGLAIIRDITESKKIQVMLLRYERLAAVGKVIAAIAHEIRNPLAVISGMSQILNTKLEHHSEYSQELDTIMTQATRLKFFMNDILEYSREMEVKKENVDSQTLMEQSLQVSQVQLGPRHANFKVEWHWEKDLPSLWVDGGRIEQILINLILNAYQALGDQGTLILSGRMERGQILMSVEDDGPGISEADLPHLFEPFFTTKKNGSGLGLSISLKIAAAHDGKIMVERLTPRGTRFTLQLPLQDFKSV